MYGFIYSVNISQKNILKRRLILFARKTTRKYPSPPSFKTPSSFKKYPSEVFTTLQVSFAQKHNTEENFRLKDNNQLMADV